MTEASGWAGVVAGCAVLTAAVTTRRTGLALLCGAIVLAGTAIGVERLRAIDRAPVARWISEDRQVVALGHVVRRERPSHGVRRARVRLTALREPGAGPWRAVDDLVQVRARPGVEFPPATVGEELRIAGEVAEPRARSDGGFDYVAYLKRGGVHALLYADTVAATGARRSGAAGFVDGVRRGAQAGIRAGLDPPLAALAEGLVLGQDERIPEQMADEFRDSGLAHLLAVSGQNVTLLSLLALPILASLGFGRRARLAGVLILIALYVPLTGAGPSILRAGAMGAAGTVAALAGRPASRWYALLLAAAFTLAIDPRAWLDPGWQLSFAAVIAILALARRVTDALAPLPEALAAGIAVTLAASVATAPLAVYHFGQVSLAGLAANLAALPAVAPAMWLGMVAAAAGQVSTPLAAIANGLNGYLVAYIAAVAHVAAAAPAAVWTVELRTPLALGTAYAVLAALAFGMARRPSAILIATAVALVVALPDRGAAHGTAEPRITFLDVGQGEATLIETPEATVLVDGGPPEAGLADRLRARGIRALDLAVLTHASRDHQGGLEQIVRELDVRILLDGGARSDDRAHARVVAAARSRRARVITGRAGETIRFGGLRLRVLGPDPRPLAEGSDPNESALVLLASYAGLDVMLPADAESDVTHSLPLRPVDVLKVAHHGSEDEGLPTLLERLAPTVAVIEVGRGNRYGHPHPRTLGALARAGLRTYRTDRDGDVRVALGPDGPRVSVERQAP